MVEKKAKEKKEKKGPKAFFEDSINCAWCGKPNKIRAVKETTVPAVPAQRTIEVFVEKDSQTKIGEHTGKSKS